MLVFDFSFKIYSNFIVLFDNDRLVAGLIAGWIGVRVEFHVRGNAVTRYEAGQGTDVAENSEFIDLKFNF